jgi:hypothetical protein
MLAKAVSTILDAGGVHVAIGTGGTSESFASPRERCTLTACFDERFRYHMERLVRWSRL